MWQPLHDAWWRLATRHHPQSFSDALAYYVLHTGSVAYRAAVTLRNAAYDRGWLAPVRLPCRVVSVGNLTVGGTGKTACVELLARKLTISGRRVGILSRGYAGKRRSYWLRGDAGRVTVHGPDGAAGDGDGLADEPQLLASHLEGIPILMDARRDRSGRFACSELACDTLVLDDGFQHRRLARDCDVVLVHARMPLGGWALLPRGPMREPLESLRRAHVIIVTKADEALETVPALSERLRTFAPDAVFATAVHAPTGLLDAASGARVEPSRLSGRRVGLLSSIGDPEGFDATVRRLYATVLWHRTFPDHHVYDAADWIALGEQARAQRPDVVLTTEKDWIRLRPWTMSAKGGSASGGDRGPWAVPLWVLCVEMKLLSGEDALDARLAGLCVR